MPCSPWLFVREGFPSVSSRSILFFPFQILRFQLKEGKHQSLYHWRTIVTKLLYCHIAFRSHNCSSINGPPSIYTILFWTRYILKQPYMFLLGRYTAVRSKTLPFNGPWKKKKEMYRVEWIGGSRIMNANPMRMKPTWSTTSWVKSRTFDQTKMLGVAQLDLHQLNIVKP